jgi:hypothetical protein
VGSKNIKNRAFTAGGALLSRYRTPTTGSEDLVSTGEITIPLNGTYN